MRRYKVGIIGCGRMGWLFNEDKLIDQPVSHIAAYSMNRRSLVTAVCDLDREKLAGVSKKYGVKKTYTDYKKMLANEALDIISICVPTVLHAEVCAVAAGSGVKAIFCEKPIAVSLQEAEDMIDACRKKNVRLTINHSRRWAASCNAVKNILKKGVIGEVDLVTAFSAAGLSNSGSHIFDLLRYYFGDVGSVAGSIITDGSADPGGRGYMRFKKGPFCFIDSSFRKYVLFGAGIYGDKGMIEFNSAVRSRKAFNLFIGKKSANESGIRELAPSAYNTPEWRPPILNAVKNIINNLENGEKILCTGEDGKASLEIALAFHESSRRGGKEIFLPLKNKKLKIIPRQTSFTEDGKLR